MLIAHNPRHQPTALRVVPAANRPRAGVVGNEASRLEPLPSTDHCVVRRGGGIDVLADHSGESQICVKHATILTASDSELAHVTGHG